MKNTWAVLALAGCYAGNYSTLTAPFVGSRVTVGCLDVAVALTDDETAPSPVVAYSFGNNCFHQTIVDLSAVRVFGVQADRTRVELAAYDPRRELRPMQLDALTAGSERIAYRSAAAPAPQEVCVDLGRLDADAPPSEQWKCLTMTDGGAR